MKRFDPLSYAEVSLFFFYSVRLISRHFSPVCTQVPDYYKNGLHAQEKFNAYRAARTQDKILARRAQNQVSDGFRPYTKQEFADAFVPMHAAVQRVEDEDRLVLMLFVTFLICFFSCVFQMYVGFTKHSCATSRLEPGSSAHSGSAFAGKRYAPLKPEENQWQEGGFR